MIGEEEGADTLRGYSSESKTGQSDAGDFDLDPWFSPPRSRLRDADIRYSWHFDNLRLSIMHGCCKYWVDAMSCFTQNISSERDWYGLETCEKEELTRWWVGLTEDYLGGRFYELYASRLSAGLACSFQA